MNERDSRVLRAGGISGILGGLIAATSFIVLAVFYFSRNLTTEQIMSMSLSQRGPSILGWMLLFVVSILFIPLFIGLYRSLRLESPAFSISGSVIGIIGMSILALGLMFLILLGLVTLPALYADVTEPERHILLIVAQSIAPPISLGGPPGLIGAINLTGLALLGVALILVGLAMLQSQLFRNAYGWLSIILGLYSIIPVVSHFPVFIIWGIVVGLKIYRLSKVH